VTAIRSNDLATALSGLREANPLVQCLTNVVVSQWTANVLLAVGASPAMVDQPQEAAQLAAVAGGVLVNLGTPTEATMAGMFAAAAAATANGRPWVLDPVAAGALTWRTDAATALLEQHHPTVVRGNASEILALAGRAGGRGVDTAHTPDAAADVASGLARQFGTVIAVSGPIDLITDGEQTVRVDNGHAWLTKVTGTGCALGAMMAAYLACVDDPLTAAVAATVTLNVAAERAVVGARGVGSFAVALLDELWSITGADLEVGAVLR
jgi:hydroxyethylthiazole kinase